MSLFQLYSRVAYCMEACMVICVSLYTHALTCFQVCALGVATETNPPESNRQTFLLAIHKALCMAEGEYNKTAEAA